MPRKEKINAKTWERERRNRMNTYFKTLSDLLPPHQEGRKLNKVDILIHATKYIKDLNNRTDELFGAHAGEAHKEELSRLKKLVTQLFSRTQLLSALLRDAGISVPTEPALEKISPLKWSNKINVEDGEKYLDRLAERKKTDKRKSKQFKVPSKQKIINIVSDSPEKVSDVKETLEHGLIEDQENHVNSIINECIETRDASVGSNEIASTALTCRNVTAPQHDAVPSETTKAKPSKRIRKLESRKKVKRKGKIIDLKMKKKKIHVVSSQSQSIANLLPGTLIWSAGKIMPLVTPITPLTSNILVSAQAQSSNPIILSNAQHNQMIVMQSLSNRVQNSVLPMRNETLMKAVQKVALNNVPSIQTSSMKNIIETTKITGRKVILPKGKEITTTTMTYKVPIPAIHRELPVVKLSESTNQDSRKSKKIVKSKKIQRRKKLDAQDKETLNANKATSVKVNSVESVENREIPSAAISKNLEINEKKRKATEDSTLAENQQPKIMKITSLPETCKSIENLRNVVERIGEETRSEKTMKPEEDHSSLDFRDSESTVNKPSVIEENRINEKSDREIVNVPSSDDSTTNKSIQESESRPENAKEVTNVSSIIDTKISKEWSPKSDNKNSKIEENLVPSESPKTSKNPVNEEADGPTALSEVDEAIAEAGVVSDKEKNVCDLGTRFDSLLRATEKTDVKIDGAGIVESTKIILNLDTNTTTTMKPEVVSTVIDNLNTESSVAVLNDTVVVDDETRIIDRSKDETLKTLTYSSINTFVPIGNRTDGLHSDLSNDLFASLQVPSSSHNPESISPTAAFLMAFPLVSSLNGKTEVLEEEMKEDLKYHSQTPPMLLQIGAIEPNSFKVKNDPPSLTIPSEKSISQEREIVKITHRSTSDVTKALPKIVNNETIKERLYKVVQFPETTIVGNDNFATSSNARPIDNPNITIPACEIQSTSIIENSNVVRNVLTTDSALTTVHHGTSGKCENSVRKCDNQTQNNSLTVSPKYEATNSNRTIVASNCTSDLSKYETNGRYPTIPDYVPGYTNFSNPPNQSRSNYVSSKTLSGNSTIISSHESTSMAYPSMRSQAVQSAYVAHTTGKEVIQQMYPNRNKDSLVNSSESMTSYVAFPPVSQTLQHDYHARAKEPYQNYDIHGKDSNLPFQSYNASSTKNSTVHDTNTTQQERSYVTSRTNDNVSSGITVKETQNIFHNYPSITQSKETTNHRDNPDNSVRLNSRETTSQSSGGKVVNFVQSTNYSSFTKDSKQNLHVTDTIFHGKRNEPQTYMPYSRDTKKTIFDASSIPQVTKSQNITNSSIPRYTATNGNTLQSQEQQNCVATSNYLQSSTISDNSVKSTTTVAHNSSNFSILSWTTFSPISGTSSVNNNNNNVNNSGNNNLVQYESGADHVDHNEQVKTACENYTYAPIHKETYDNILPNESFTTDSSIVNKARGKLVHDSLKPQIFDDSSKAKVVQPIVTEQKTVRSHNQSENNGDSYKFVGENKNKVNKYPMGTAYTQTEFSTLEQQQQQASKSHQSGKSEKSNYPMPTYDSQATFDIAETNVPIKCNTEIYSSSNYKYGVDKDTNLQVKYQPHAQTQATILHHDSANYNSAKHVHQQQTTQAQQQQTITSKSKPIVQQQLQQQPVRPPVNWMMTPEIKHNSNIADLILPPIGKELELCQNNIFTQPPSYNQSAPNQFYNNYDATVSGPHGFPNIPTLQSDPRRIPETFYTEEQPFSWSPTKNSQIEQGTTIKSTMEQHVVVPSTLPTLVGDLALGTNISEKQSFLFGQMAQTRGNKDITQPTVIKDKDIVVRDYQTMLNTQNAQQTVQGTSFLSVSQLVEHEKAEKSHQQNHHSHNTHQHHHHHQQQQQHQSSQQSQQQTRKHQRKNANTSPRTTAKRQIETRKQTGNVGDQLHGQNADEQKLTTPHAFPDQSYHHQQQQQQHQQTQQTQKYQQNDVHWRNRQCKSNYTAEALIGGNTSVHDNNNQDKQLQASTIKSFSTEYTQNKYPSGLATTDMVMPPLNYLTNTADDQNSYGQSVNQNFNHSSYAYSPNTNIYPTTNFITSISNTPTSYMMPLHDNPSDFIESNSFLLPSVTSSTKTTINVSSTVSTVSSARLATSSSLTVATNPKGQHQHYTSGVVKNQNCEKRNNYGTATKKSKRKTDSMHNLEFPLSSAGPQIDDYHSHPHHHHHHHHHSHPSHPSSFLAPPHANPLYQNHSHTSTVGLTTNSNRISRAGTTSGNNVTLGHHHPSGTSLTNFNLSTIFPEINDKVTGYKPPNVIPPGLSQSSNHPTATYPQRGNYTTNNTLGHVSQESTQFTTDLPPAPPPGVLHYKTT